jgi:hypothetical protein
MLQRGEAAARRKRAGKINEKPKDPRFDPQPRTTFINNYTYYLLIEEFCYGNSQVCFDACTHRYIPTCIHNIIPT